MADAVPLKEICKANKGGRSYKKISELSGVPENTVNNFFSAGSKDPSVYTAGPICRVCNVSLDAYFGIKPTEQDSAADHKLEIAEQDKAALRRENDLLSDFIARQQREAANKNRLIYCLAFVAVMAIAALVPYIYSDITNPTFGLWRGGPSLVGAVVIAALSVGVAGTLYLLISSRRDRRS